MLVATLPKNCIPDILERKGWSIYKLAKTAGMSYQAIHNVVTSPEIPENTYYDTLRRIARALDVKIDDLEKEGE